MIRPETCDFFGNELDKAKLEIASYWKDKYEKTQKALDVAVNALKYLKYEQPNNQPRLPDLYVIDKALAKINEIAKGE